MVIFERPLTSSWRATSIRCAFRGIGVHSASRGRSAATGCGTAASGLTVARPLALLCFPVIAHLLEGVLERTEGDPVRRFAVTVGLLRRFQRVDVRRLGLGRRALQRRGKAVSLLLAECHRSRLPSAAGGQAPAPRSCRAVVTLWSKPDDRSGVNMTTTARAAVLWGTYQPWKVQEIEVHDRSAVRSRALEGRRPVPQRRAPRHRRHGPAPGDARADGPRQLLPDHRRPRRRGHRRGRRARGARRCRSATTSRPASCRRAAICRYCTTGRGNLCDAGAGTLGGGMITDGTHRHFVDGSRSRCWPSSARSPS